jgi:hypothetical protein
MMYLNNRYARLILVITVLALLGWAVIGCQDFGQAPALPTEPAEETTQQEPPPTVIKNEDRAIMAVYEYLLNKAESSQAKRYLADFYSISDNWSATSELSQDGTRTWYIVVDMTDVEAWEERSYWQQASWFILQNGEVKPSIRFQANAVRIEADLQELSLPGPQAGGG